MEKYGYKYIHKIPEIFATMNSRNNRSIDIKPNQVMNPDFMSILYSKPLRDYKKPNFGIGDRVSISDFDLPFTKGCKPQFTQEIFGTVAIIAANNFQHLQSMTNKKKLYVDNSTRRN